MPDWLRNPFKRGVPCSPTARQYRAAGEAVPFEVEYKYLTARTLRPPKVGRPSSNYSREEENRSKYGPFSHNVKTHREDEDYEGCKISRSNAIRKRPTTDKNESIHGSNAACKDQSNRFLRGDTEGHVDERHQQSQIEDEGYSSDPNEYHETKQSQYNRSESSDHSREDTEGYQEAKQRHRLPTTLRKSGNDQAVGANVPLRSWVAPETSDSKRNDPLPAKSLSVREGLRLQKPRNGTNTEARQNGRDQAEHRYPEVDQNGSAEKAYTCHSNNSNGHPGGDNVDDHYQSKRHLRHQERSGNSDQCRQLCRTKHVGYSGSGNGQNLPRKPPHRRVRFEPHPSKS